MAKPRIGVTAVLAVFALLAGACGDSDSDGSSGGALTALGEKLPEAIA